MTAGLNRTVAKLLDQSCGLLPIDVVLNATTSVAFCSFGGRSVVADRAHLAGTRPGIRQIRRTNRSGAKANRLAV